MKLATLACLAALSLAAGSAALRAQPAPEAKPAEERPADGRAQDARTLDARRPDPRATERQPATGRSAGPTAARAGERRRRSYAACNRASHQRQLTGGRRRRFLIRCRLGYERTRQPPAVQPAGAPPPAGRRP